MLSTLVFWLNNNAGRCSHVCICTCLYGRSTRELSVSCFAASNPPPPLPSSQVRVWSVGCSLSDRDSPTIYRRPPTPSTHTNTKSEDRLASSLRLNTPVGRLRHTLCQYNSVLASSKRAHFCDLRTLNHIYIVSSFCFN